MIFQSCSHCIFSNFMLEIIQLMFKAIAATCGKRPFKFELIPIDCVKNRRMAIGIQCSASLPYAESFYSLFPLLFNIRFLFGKLAFLLSISDQHTVHEIGALLHIPLAIKGDCIEHPEQQLG